MLRRENYKRIRRMVKRGRRKRMNRDCVRGTETTWGVLVIVLSIIKGIYYMEEDRRMWIYDYLGFEDFI